MAFSPIGTPVRRRPRPRLATASLSAAAARARSPSTAAHALTRGSVASIRASNPRTSSTEDTSRLRTFAAASATPSSYNSAMVVLLPLPLGEGRGEGVPILHHRENPAPRPRLRTGGYLAPTAKRPRPPASVG